jgi:hypothetical protein
VPKLAVKFEKNVIQAVFMCINDNPLSILGLQILGIKVPYIAERK